MIARVIDPSEWAAVGAATGLPQIGPSMPDEDCHVVVVEDDGKIVATMAVLRVVHMESLWIDPSYRGAAGTFRCLLRKGFDLARDLGAKWIWACSDTERMTSIINRLMLEGGTQIKVDSFILPTRSI